MATFIREGEMRVGRDTSIGEMRGPMIEILGAGGVGKSVWANLVSNGVETTDVRFRDDDDDLEFVTIKGFNIPVAHPIIDVPSEDFGVPIVAVGSLWMQRRKDLWDRVVHMAPPNATHRTMINYGEIGYGNAFCANTVIHPCSKVGNNNFFGLGVTIDHDNVVGSHCYFAPGVTIGSPVVINDGVLIGINASILPGVTIGKGAVVGAGAVVLKSVEPRTVVAGVPAKMIRPV